MKIPVEGIDGCAVLNLTRGTCTIYIGFRSTAEIRRHERAHCHGYGHRWTGRKYEWHPIPELEMYSLGERREITENKG